MFNWLQDFIKDARQGCDFAVRASEDRVAEVEARLGVALPPSYRHFLLRWNGARVCGEQIFSCQDLLDYVEAECGFAPYNGELRLAGQTDGDYRRIYNLKPTHFLAFASPDLSSDLYCFDTHRTYHNEYIVCEFVHDDDDLARLMRPDCPSFEAYLMEKLYGGIDSTDIFWDDDMEEAIAERYFEEKSAYWEDYFQQQLTSMGANMDTLPHLRWAEWRQSL